MKQSKLEQGNGEVKHKTEDERKTKVQLIGELAEMRQRITELEASEVEYRQVEKAPLDVEQDWLSLFNSLEDVMLIIDKDYNIENMNDAGLALLKKSRDEVIGRKCYEVISGADSPPEYCPCRQSSRTKKVASIDRYERRLGRYFSIKASPIFDENGEIVKFVDLRRDITERKRAEEESIRLSNAVRMSTDSIVISNLDAKIIDVNEATLKMYGTDDKRDLIGKNSFDLIAPEELEKALAGTKEVLEKGYVMSREYHIITKDGGRVPVEMSVAIMKKADGKPIGFVAVSRDITERKQAEEELEARKRRLESYIESMVDGVVLSDLKGTTVDINKACLELLGYKRKEDVVGRPGFIRAISKKDMPEIDALLEGIIKKGYIKDREITVLAQDRREIPILLSATLIEDPQGKPTSIFTVFKDITERKKAEAQIRKLSSVVDQSIDGIATADLEPKLTYVNDAFARMHGYSPAEMVGMRHTNLHSEEQMDEFRKAIDQIKTKGSWTGELGHVRKDGTPFPTHMSVTLLTDEQGKPTGITVVCRDITEQKKAEKRLQESEGKLRVMFGSITDGVIVTDLTGTVVEANDGAAHLVGYSNKEELIGRNAFEFVSPKYRALAMNAAKKTLKEGLVQEKTEYTILTADGREIDTDSSAAVLYDSSGNPTGIINVVRDITERKKAEEELQEKNEQLKAQREELVRKATELELVSQAKSEFLASMSHELRTPLSAVIGFSELMLDGIPGEINDEQRGCLNDILDSGRRLLNLINDILDLSKVEAGKIELKLQNLDIANIVSGVVQIMKPVLDKNGQEIEVSAMQGLPKVRGDKNRLEQILLNLLSNASKFTQQGGRVRIHVGRKGDYCQVAVIDTGIGIKKEDQEHVFEAFVQGETLSDRKKEGTGLGLTLTKRFVETMGGRIWMESEYEKGSTFIFTIPLAGEPLETSLGDKQSSYS